MKRGRSGWRGGLNQLGPTQATVSYTYRAPRVMSGPHRSYKVPTAEGLAAMQEFRIKHGITCERRTEQQGLLRRIQASNLGNRSKVPSLPVVTLKEPDWDA